MNEMKRLAAGLVEKGISFKFDKFPEGCQIIVFDKNNDREWDAICTKYSYGHESGKLEIMGSIVRPNISDAVEGYLTADDILRRL